MGIQKIEGFGPIIEAGRNPSLHSVGLKGCIDFLSFVPTFIKSLEKLNRNTTFQGITISGCDCNACRNNKDPFGDQQALLETALKQTYGISEITVGQWRVDAFSHRFGRFKLSSNTHIICSLNYAGRRYMVEDNRLEKGIEVLGKVSDELSSIYFHLRENVSTFFGGGEAIRKLKRGAASGGSVSKRHRS